MHFLEWNVLISLNISLIFFPEGQIDNVPSFVQIMAWRRSGHKPLSEPMMLSLLTHICVTRPQWVNWQWDLIWWLTVSGITSRVCRDICSNIAAWVTCLCMGLRAHFNYDFFHCNSDLIEIFHCCLLDYDEGITTKFCTWHDNYAVMTCAKICRNLINRNWITAKQIFCQF